jgi:hypothetical protein
MLVFQQLFTFFLKHAVPLGNISHQLQLLGGIKGTGQIVWSQCGSMEENK